MQGFEAILNTPPPIQTLEVRWLVLRSHIDFTTCGDPGKVGLCGCIDVYPYVDPKKARVMSPYSSPRSIRIQGKDHTAGIWDLVYHKLEQPNFQQLS